MVPLSQVRSLVLLVVLLRCSSVVAAERSSTPWVLDPPMLATSGSNGLSVDAGGFLWFSEEGGLHRFDGKERLSVGVSGELTSSYLYQVLALPDASVWAVPGGGVGACDPGVDLASCLAELRGSPGLLRSMKAQGPRPMMSVLPTPLIYAAAAAQGGGLWLGAQERVGFCDGEHPPAAWAEVEGTVTALVEVGGTRLFAGTSAGLMEFEVSSQGPRRALRPVARRVHEAVTALALDSEGRLWVGTPVGLWKIVRASAAPTPVGDELPSPDIRALATDDAGGIWVGTARGPVRLSEGVVMPIDMQGVPDVRVTAFAADATGGMWIGFRTGAVRRARRQVVQNFGMGEGLDPVAAAAVLAGRDHSVWATHAQLGIVRWQGGKRVERIEPPALQGHAVTILAQGAADGGLWVGTNGAGLWRYWDERWQRAEGPAAVSAANVSLIHFASDGALWLSADGAVARNELSFARGQPVLEELAPLPPRPQPCDGPLVAAASRGSKGEWFAAKSGALLSWSGETWRCFVPPSPGKARVPLTSMVASPDGTLWLGSREGGLLRFREGKFRLFDENDGLPCDAVTQVLDDGQGHLWYTCGIGAVRVDQGALEAYADGLIPFVPSLHIDRSWGMSHAETSRNGSPAAALDASGQLWIATQGGVSRVSDVAALRPPPAPKLTIRGVTVNGVEVDVPLEGNVLARGHSANVRVALAAPTLAPHERVCFGYQNLSRDKRVVSTGPLPYVDLTNLEPGTHALAFHAARACGQWGREAKILRLTLLPPWYSQSTTWAMVALFCLVSAWTFHRVRFRVLAARYAALEAERKRIARDLHDGLGQGFTSLRYHLQAAEVQTARHSDTADVLGTLVQARSLLQQVEQEARNTVWALRSAELEAKPLPRALADLASALPHDAIGVRPRVTIEAPPDFPRLPAMLEAELFAVAREALTNAIRHAKARHVQLTLERDETEVRLAVTDDGAGFSDDAESAVARGHFGVLGMRERLRRLGGVLAIDSSPGSGTTVLAAVPLAETQETST